MSQTPCKILIVEDCEDTARSQALLLEMNGHEVYWASDGESALRRAAQDTPQLVLLDLGLPGMDGLEVARKLKERYTRLCIIAVTGYSGDEMRTRMNRAGIDMLMVKPVDPTVLMNVVDKICSVETT